MSKSTQRSALRVLTLVAGLVTATAAAAQEPAPLGMTGTEQGYTKGTILGVQGYYEVTPSGAIVLYPATPVTAPGVMHTILGMFGGTSLVGRRGYFQITPNGEMYLYFPPGAQWPGAAGTYVMPGMPGQTGTAMTR
ncbi:MAG: hypothetical protein QNJ30_13140 [Kiloniellales bacterium]|nr:hypothetical protein [Kiloniellales bacterium]